ncbi:hypothetical protein [Kitasatospora kifunensis]|uniref:Uncharacterized protein n=1 Tax=Kitasatospora kifunensis TaxID=58351 RepID=A0A7W7QYQ5_KITKI|nr:hypothetical protein [Kitasatospora kifunensis]MBB4922270.1 hypothetical protein [Kitasatospora kifunensis]
MHLYTLTGAVALDDPEFGHFDADEQGGFDLPDELSDRLHRFAFRGKPAWETDVEHQRRLMAEELERRKDPATLLGVVEQLMKAAQQAAAPQVASPVVDAVPVRRASRRGVSAVPAE